MVIVDANVVRIATLAPLSPQPLTAEACTFDRDFERFAGVRSFTPAEPVKPRI